MDKIKLGIIGIGNMGTGHANSVRKGMCPEIELVAVADINEDRLKWAQEEFKGEVKCFNTAEEMLYSGLIDSCLIAVPHYDHTKYAIECMKRGIHVMVEKPAGVYTKQVRLMNAEAKKNPKVVFGMMFNQRTNCLYRKLRELVQSGEYGQIRRTNWIITDWYRPQCYYDSGNWRATWAGEGGGVLINQAPHNLDLWQWICGMPDSVTAFCNVGKFHNIEVEDDATLYTKYKNGATGVFITSTGEYPGTNRLEISGSLGKLVLENGMLKWWRTITENGECEYTEIKQDIPETAHKGILQNFADAVEKGAELIAPGYEGINELTLSNAAYLSDWKGNVEITLPFDADEFDKRLKELSSNSHYQSGEAKDITSVEYKKRWAVNW